MKVYYNILVALMVHHAQIYCRVTAQPVLPCSYSSCSYSQHIIIQQMFHAQTVKTKIKSQHATMYVPLVCISMIEVLRHIFKILIILIRKSYTLVGMTP